MEDSANSNFLDDTSLLSLKSPLKTSTGTKDNKGKNMLFNDEQESLINSVFERTDEHQFSDLVLDKTTNVLMDAAKKALDFDRAESDVSHTTSQHSRVTDTSSLGIMSLDSLTDLSTTEFYKPVKQKVKKKRPKDMKQIMAMENMGNVSELSSQLSQTDSYLDKLEDYSESAIDLEDIIAAESKFSLDEKLYILYGEKSQDMKRYILQSSENQKSSRRAASLYEHRGDCQDKTEKQKTSLPLQEKYEPNIPHEPTSLFGASGDSHLLKMSSEIIETPRCPSDLKRGFIFTPKSRNEFGTPSESYASFTPSKQYAFRDLSSFKVEDVYRTSKVTDTNISEVDFRDDQISARSSSLAAGQNRKTSNEKTATVKPLDSTQTVISKDKTSKANRKSKTTSISVNDSEKVPESNLDLACFMNLAETYGDSVCFDQIMDDLGISETEFDKEDAVKLLMEDEEKFNKEHMLEIDPNDSKSSQFSTWSLTIPDTINPPSWYVAENDVMHSQISIGEIIGARTENLGTLEANENKERPYFGTNVITPPKPAAESAINLENEEDVVTPKRTSNDAKIFDTFSHTPDTIGGNSSVNTPSLSTISRVLSTVYSEDASELATEFLFKVPQGRPKKTAVSRYSDHKQMLKTVKEDTKPKSKISPCRSSENISQTKTYLSRKKLLPKSRYSSSETLSSSSDIEDDTVKLVISKNECYKQLQKIDAKHEAISKEMKKLKEEKKMLLSKSCQLPRLKALRSKSLEDVPDRASNNTYNSPASTVPDDIRYSSLDNVFLPNSASTTKNDSGNSSSKSPTPSTCSVCSNTCNHSQHSTAYNCTAPCSINSSRCSNPNKLCIPAYVNAVFNPQDHSVQFVIQNTSSIPVTVNNAPMFNHTMQHNCLANDLANCGTNLNFAASFPMQHMFNRTVQALPLYPTPGNGVCAMGPTEFQHSLMCVGDSQQDSLKLKNVTNMPLYYHLILDASEINRTSLPNSSVGISFPEVVWASSGNSINIELVFAPTLEGKFKADLHVIPSFTSVRDSTCPSAGSPLIVKLHYEAEKPCINLSNDGDPRIFAMEGSSVTSSVVLTNLKTSAVPVRLTICGDSERHSFSFGIRDLNTDSSTQRGAQYTFLSPKAIICCLSGSEDVSKPNTVVIPVVFHAEKCTSGSEEMVLAEIAATLESSTVRANMLAYVRLTANVGIVKLGLKHRVQAPLLFKTQPGARFTQYLTITNSGSCITTAHVSVISDDCAGYFSVVPPVIKLHPRQDITLTLTFEPTSGNYCRGFLRANVPDNGESFNLIEVIGQAISNQNPQTSNNSSGATAVNGLPREPMVIVSNRKYIAWGGIDVKSSSKKNTVLHNPSNTSHYMAKVYIKQKQHCFKIWDDEKDEEIQFVDIELPPKGQKRITVMFQPPHVSSYCGSLIIKPIGESGSSHLSCIALSGYGGVSKITLLGLLPDEGSHCLRLNSNCEGNITLYNVGSRAAFVKVMVQKDSEAHNTDEILSVTPSEFIILQQESKTLHVKYPFSNTVANVSIVTKDCGYLQFFYGDEIMRQKLHRSNPETRYNSLLPNDPLRNMNFDVPYEDEDKVPPQPLLPDTQRDIALFYSSLQRILVRVTMCFDISNFSRFSCLDPVSFLQDSSSSYYQTPAVASCTAMSFSPPVKDAKRSSKYFAPSNALTVSTTSSSAELSINTISTEDYSVVPSEGSLSTTRNSVNGDTNVALFTVQPESLVLQCNNKDTKVIIHSNSQEELKFNLTWPANILSVSPGQGTISPRGESEVRVKLVTASQGKLDENVEAFIKVVCSDIERHVPVTILKTMPTVKVSEPSPARRAAANSTLPCTSASNTVPSMTKRVGSVHADAPFSFPDIIKLKTTSVRNTSETTCQLINRRNNPSKWYITPEVSRRSSTSPSWVMFVPSNGTLKPLESTTIVVKFKPKQVCHYIKYWELHIGSFGGRKQRTFKVEGVVCNPDAEAKEVHFLSEEKQQISTSDTSVASKRDSPTASEDKSSGTKRKTIYVDSSYVELPSVKPGGKKTTTYITLNNPLEEDCQFSVIKPDPPFQVNFSTLTVRGKHFLKVPVRFMPEVASTYTDEVTFEPLNGCSAITIVVKGICT